MSGCFKRHALRVFVMAVLAGGTPGFAGAAVTLSKETPLAQGVSVREQVLAECEIQTRLPEAVARASSHVELVPGPGSLVLEITDVHALGGWVFSGPKWMEVTGMLPSGASFRAKRYSATDFFAGGTCGILGKIIRALGGDIAQWLTQPVDGAEIGDAR